MATTEPQKPSESEKKYTRHSKFQHAGMGSCEVASTRIDETHRLAVLYCEDGNRQTASINTIVIDPKTQRDAPMNIRDITHGFNLEVRISPTEHSLSYDSNTVNAPLAAQEVFAAVKRIHTDGRLDKKEAFQLDALRALGISTFPLPDKFPRPSEKPEMAIAPQNRPTAIHDMSADDQATIVTLARTVAKTKTIGK